MLDISNAMAVAIARSELMDISESESEEGNETGLQDSDLWWQSVLTALSDETWNIRVDSAPLGTDCIKRILQTSRSNNCPCGQASNADVVMFATPDSYRSRRLYRPTSSAKTQEG